MLLLSSCLTVNPAEENHVIVKRVLVSPRSADCFVMHGAKNAQACANLSQSRQTDEGGECSTVLDESVGKKWGLFSIINCQTSLL